MKIFYRIFRSFLYYNSNLLRICFVWLIQSGILTYEIVNLILQMYRKIMEGIEAAIIFVVILRLSIFGLINTLWLEVTA